MPCPTDPQEILAGATSSAERTAQAIEWLSVNFRICPEVGRRLIEEELPRAESAGEAIGAAWLRFYLGWIHLDNDDYPAAFRLFEGVRRTFESLGEAVGICRVFNALGAAQVSIGAYDQSLDYFNRCVESAEALGRLEIAGGAEVNIADCLWELDEFEEAREAIERSYCDFQLLPQNIQLREIIAGRIYRSVGRGEEAERHLLSAIENSSGVAVQIVDARRGLAELYLDQGRLAEAGRALAGCVEMADEAGERVSAAFCRLARARLTLALGEAGGLKDAEAALAASRALGARRLEADALRVRTEALKAVGRFAEALDSLEQHITLKDSLKSERTRIRIRGLREEQARREAAIFRQQLDRLSALSDIGRRIISSLDLGMIAEAARAGADRLMDASQLLLGTVGGPPGRVLRKIVSTDGERVERPDPVAALDPFLRGCLERGEEIRVDDAEAEWAAVARPGEAFPGGYRSLLGVPLLTGDRLVGLLGLRSPRSAAYGREQVEALRVIGAYAAIAIVNHDLFRQVEELASIDPLTGLQNRRSIMTALGEEFRQFQRYGRQAGVIVLDADRFKSINDRYGHEAGDLALSYLASILRREARSCDQIGRHGGEEFLLVLPLTDIPGALACAERFRSALAQAPLVLHDGSKARLTASFGVAVFHTDDESPDAALSRADQAMYRSKSEGRNRVSAEA
ncbi:MAG TPA: diguanylate cyclase [Rectinemataceae bacterium]|nr:diguanylate cyclase [Rectinemataceae bacterium]